MAWTLAGMRLPLGVCKGFASRPSGERRTSSLSSLCFQTHPAPHQVSSIRRLSSRRSMKTSDNVLVPGIQSDISTSTEESPQVDDEDVHQVDNEDVPQVDADDVPQVQTEKVQVCWSTDNVQALSRYLHYRRMRHLIDKNEGGLDAFSRGYEKFGFNRSADGITYREWAPGAKSASLVGDFNNWNPNADIMTRNEFGVWEIFLPNNADGSPPIPHGSRVKIHMETPSGIKDSIPAWIKFSVQAPGEIPYNGIYYDPLPEEKFEFKHPQPKAPKSLRIYEAHVGMSSPEPKINTYANFRDEVLPRIKRLGYNAVQHFNLWLFKSTHTM